MDNSDLELREMIDNEIDFDHNDSVADDTHAVVHIVKVSFLFS